MSHSTKALDIAGKRFGMLVAIKRLEPIKRNSRWECKCDCGKIEPVWQSGLACGDAKSCGCNIRKSRITHGKSRTKIHALWRGMIRRCSNPKDSNYKNYGGRGISVCERWKTFQNFYVDMGERPEGMSLERINNDAGYSPENCKWATWKEQQNNKRCSRKTYELLIARISDLESEVESLRNQLSSKN